MLKPDEANGLSFLSRKGCNSAWAERRLTHGTCMPVALSISRPSIEQFFLSHKGVLCACPYDRCRRNLAAL